MAYTTINDPSAYFHTQLYTGNGSSQSITNDANAGNFKPDWIWVKNRDSTDSHMLSDSSRGSTNALTSQGTNAEFTPTNGNLAFLTDGFSFGSNNNYNRNTDSFVAWQWKANGGTTASNTDGTITSTVQANTAAGFSIISYTGNGTNGATIGHGLSQTPQIFFPKCLSTSTNWEMYYFPTGGTKQYGYLNLTNAFSTWSYTAPTSTTIGLSGSGDSNGNGRTMIGYAFHSVQGYSKIGTYTGNSNADGVFVYTGFRPAWLMVKNMSAGQSWWMWDDARIGYNGANYRLRADADTAEDADSKVDFVSNGFKFRDGDNAWNYSGNDFLYMAFARNPLVATNDVIALAR